jgi:hypothetical protein
MKKQCPRCGGEARRSHHHGVFQKTILRALRVRPYRCRDCGNRFFRFSASSSHPKDQAASQTVFDQAPKKNGDFKQIIAQMREKESKLGLGKQDRHMTDELRRLHQQAKAEGLAAGKRVS